MTNYFKVEQNPINNNWMVFSKCEQLPQCFAFKGKGQANSYRDLLNVRANQEALVYKGKITFKL